MNHASSHTVRELVEWYMDKRKAEGLGENNQNEMRRPLRWLIEETGETASANAINTAQMRVLRDKIENRSVGTQGTSVPLDQCQASDPSERIKSDTSIRYWRYIKDLFFRAADDHLIAANPVATLTIRKRKDEDTLSPEPFSSEELKRLFSLPLYAGYRSKARRSEPGNCLVRDAHWWSGVMPLYTGLRAGETSQLLPADFVFDHVVPHILIRRENDEGQKIKFVKNSSSVRAVPLSPVLLALGLRQFVTRRAKIRPGERVFFEFRTGTKGKRSEGMQRFWRDYLIKFDLHKPGRATHVMRHTTSFVMKDADVMPHNEAAALGHSQGTQTEKYGKGAHLEKILTKAILKIDYGFDVVEFLGGPFDPKTHGE